MTTERDMLELDSISRAIDAALAHERATVRMRRTHAAAIEDIKAEGHTEHQAIALLSETIRVALLNALLNGIHLPTKDVVMLGGLTHDWGSVDEEAYAMWRCNPYPCEDEKRTAWLWYCEDVETGDDNYLDEPPGITDTFVPTLTSDAKDFRP